MSQDQNKSQMITIVRGLVIVFVICAHVAYITRNNAIGLYSMHLLSNIGSVGVGIFFFCSGLCFHPWKYTLSTFVIRKGKTIGIPWIFIGTLVWLYVVLRKGDISIISWMRFLSGYLSYLYF